MLIVSLPRNRFQMPHPSCTGGLASLGLLTPFVLACLRGGILIAYHVSLKVPNARSIEVFHPANGRTCYDREAELVPLNECKRDENVLRSSRRCASGCASSDDRICNHQVSPGPETPYHPRPIFSKT
jgi:hypothetical protein